MAKAKPQHLTAKALRQSRNANLACTQGVDACELLLIELQARRVRLRELLQLVWKEAERLPARRTPLRSGVKCENVRVERSA